MELLQENKPASQQSQQNSAELLNSAIQATCANLTIYCRDSNLPYELAHKYQTGMIIRERGIVDTTALCGGVPTSHRYMILSNHMAPLFQFEGKKQWALCVAPGDSRFLVLGKAKTPEKRVTVLLHLQNETWELFQKVDMNIFKKLREGCYNIFVECLKKEPIPSVSTEEWLARCQFPVGMSDSGEFFPLKD